MSNLKYRPDIDGLRAVAVLLVILFHAGFPYLPGGFIGVDIFFVISGFLIARILYTETLTHNFSIVKFYERRFKRIFPALFFMVVITWVAACFVLMPVDFRDYSQSLGAVALFASNLLFWKESNYFGGASEEKPLLHTWSLAVEEQYYFLFPIVLFLLVRYYPKYVKHGLALWLAVSLAFCIYISNSDATQAFFSPVSRVWELLIGALLALDILPKLKSDKAASALTFLGFGMIVAASICYTSKTIFPSYTALAPCLGAALLIYAGGGNRNPVSALLSWKPVVFVGLVSYSLYLWHWPLIVLPQYFAKNALLREVTPIEMTGLMLIAFAMAVLSWRFVERPFRYASLLSNRRVLFPVVAIGSALMLAFGLYGHITHGFPQRLSAQEANIANAAFDTNPLRDKCENKTDADIREGRACVFGDLKAKDVSFAFIGDSFADALAPGIDHVAKEHGKKGIFIFKGGCHTLIGVHQPCEKIVEAALHYANETDTIKTVLIANRWTAAVNGTRFGLHGEKDWFLRDNETRQAGYPENLEVFKRSLPRTLAALDRKKAIYLIAYVPEQQYIIPRSLALRDLYDIKGEISIPLSVHEKRQANLRQLLKTTNSKVHIIDVGKKMCDANYCHVMQDGTVMYADDNHLSSKGAIKISPLFDEALR